MLANALVAALLSAPLAAAAVIEVDVGETPLTFNQQKIVVSKGDVVVFTLYPSHDVISGNFDKPCEPNDVFYSGPFSNTDNGKKKFVVNVTSEDPMYWYCGVPTHCQKGMVGGWNLP